MKLGMGRNEFTAAAQVGAAVTTLLPGDGDGCVQEGSRGAVQGRQLLTWPPVSSPPGRSA